MNKLADLIGVSKETNHALKNIRDMVGTFIIALLMCIDWDKTLDLWGF